MSYTSLYFLSRDVTKKKFQFHFGRLDNTYTGFTLSTGYSIQLFNWEHSNYYFSLHMHAKPSFAYRLQAAKMASSYTSAQNNGPRAQNNGAWVSSVPL